MVLEQPVIQLVLAWHNNREMRELIVRWDCIHTNMQYRVGGANEDLCCQQLPPAAVSVGVVLHSIHAHG